jgi:hypothetical protein
MRISMTKAFVGEIECDDLLTQSMREIPEKVPVFVVQILA